MSWNSSGRRSTRAERSTKPDCAAEAAPTGRKPGVEVDRSVPEQGVLEVSFEKQWLVKRGEQADHLCPWIQVAKLAPRGRKEQRRHPASADVHHDVLRGIQLLQDRAANDCQFRRPGCEVNVLAGAGAREVPQHLQLVSQGADRFWQGGRGRGDNIVFGPPLADRAVKRAVLDDQRALARLQATLQVRPVEEVTVFRQTLRQLLLATIHHQLPAQLDRARYHNHQEQEDKKQRHQQRSEELLPPGDRAISVPAANQRESHRLPRRNAVLAARHLLLFRRRLLQRRGTPQAECEVSRGVTAASSATARDEMLVIGAERDTRYHLRVPRIAV